MPLLIVLVSCVLGGVVRAGYQPIKLVQAFPFYPVGPVYSDIPVNRNPPSAKLTRCDPNVVAAIEQYWWANGIPQNLIQTAISNKKEVVVETSEGYYSSDVSCVFSYFTRTSVSSASVLIRSILKNTNSYQDKTIQVTESRHESRGTTYDPASKVRRYHVFYNSGVTAIYSCSESSDAQPGSPAGFIKIAEDGFEFPETPLIIERARNVLQSVGVDIQTFYGWSCPTKGFLW